MDGCCFKGEFFNNTSFFCEKCGKNCNLCENLDICLQCEAGYSLIKGFCCKDDEFYDENQRKCSNCSENCMKCEDFSQCLSCNEEKSYFSHGFCCEKSTFFLGKIGVCTGCYDKNCEKCEGNTKENCVKCDDNYRLSNGFCCEFGQFYDKTTKNCENCSENCFLCENTTFCSLCNSNFELNPFTNSCCKTGEFYNENTRNCEKCAENCEICSKNPDKCYKCYENYSFSGFSCIKQSNSSENCFFLDAQCLENCPVKYFAIKSQCFPCGFQCKTCVFSENYCINCEENFIFYQNSCLEACPSHKFLDVLTGICENCSDSCWDCYEKNPENCLNCPVNFYLKGTICEEKDENSLKNLSFSVFLQENDKNIAEIHFSEEIFIANYINLSQIFTVKTPEIPSEFYTYSIVWGNDNKTLLFALLFLRSLYKPEILLNFSEISSKYIKNKQNGTFLLNSSQISLILDTFFVIPLDFPQQISLITQFFNSIFVVILVFMIISWLFNPRRESLLWYIVDAFQLAYFCLFLEIDFPMNLHAFLMNLNVFNLDFFLYFGKNITNTGKIEYFSFVFTEENHQENVYKYLKTGLFLLNGFNAFLLIILLWIVYFLCKIVLNFLRFRTYEEKNENSLLKSLDKIHKKVMFSLIIRMNFFFLNSVFFGLLVNFMYFARNPNFFSIFLSFCAFFYLVFLAWKCYKIVNNPLIFNDSEQINHYLTLFKDVDTSNFLARNHHLIIEARKIVSISIIVFLGQYPEIALIFLLIVQGLSVMRYVKFRPFISKIINLISFITNLCTLAFVSSLFQMNDASKLLKERKVISEDRVDQYFSAGFVSFSLIFMMNIIYLCVMLFIFAETCAKNLDCVCFFLLEEEENEEENRLVEEKKLEKNEKKREILTKEQAKIVHSFSNVKDCAKFI